MSGLESARTTTAEEDEQRSHGCAETHSAGDQPDNVNRLKGREAGTVGRVRKGGEPHERDEKNQERTLSAQMYRLMAGPR